MPDYRRWRVAGGSYFFTVNLLDRRKRLQDEVMASILAFSAGDRLSREDTHDRNAVR